MWNLWTGILGIAGTLLAVVNSVEAAGPTHPVVPGFDRIYSADDAEAVAGGKLLLTELNCVSCHRVEGETAAQLKAKQAPVLDSIGNRVQLEWLEKYLTSTHASKGGTTMPDLFTGLDGAERKRKVQALVQFLASTGAIQTAMGDGGAVSRGRELFHRIGCVACHDPQRDDAKPIVGSVPLGAVHEKYSLPSLTDFLKNPLAVRPGGRMPSLKLDDKQARDIACFFLRDVTIAANVNYAYYEESWQKLPDFNALKPKATGTSSGFDVGVRQRDQNFGLRFTGFIHVATDGDYRFWIGSDDGSRLSIDGEVIVDNDGIHPHTVKEGRKKLTKGVHKVLVDYFEQGGEETLTVEFQGPGRNRQLLGSIATLTAEPPKQEVAGRQFKIDDALVVAGRKDFASLGCASCHQMKIDNEVVQTELKAKPLSALKRLDAGCLAASPKAGLPNYHLSDHQRAHLSAAIESLGDRPADVDPSQSIRQSLAQFNCVACHVRDKTGGVAETRNEFFVGTMKEMGDEGRLPPHLDGVGDKLTENWLRDTLNNGAKDRPYMFTMMPQFGGANVGHLLDSFRKVDLMEGAEVAEYSLPASKMKASGRHLVGDKALGCIKCHTFGKYKATGIQSIDLTTMSRRLRSDWFHRYMLNPQNFRPGTRMPAPWPFGQATIRTVLDADPQKQMHAVWLYLKDGNKAGIPSGLSTGAIVLKAEKEPRVYRNFIDGVSARGIAVAYPERVNLCFDADQVCLAVIWENDFIDAAKHWVGRGPGNQRPLGDNVMSLVRGVPFASLDDEKSTWPTSKPGELGYRFRGYQFNAKRQPAFRYSIGAVSVTDEPVPADSDSGLAVFDRVITLAGKTDSTLWFRAAAASKIEADRGAYVVDDHLRISVRNPGSEPARIRDSEGRKELLIPVSVRSGKTELTIRYEW